MLGGSTTNVAFLTQLRASQVGAQVNDDGFALEPDMLDLGPEGGAAAVSVAIDEAATARSFFLRACVFPLDRDHRLSFP